MKKGKILASLLALLLIPMGVKAESRTVNSQEELKTALENTEVTEVVLGQDVETLGKINITRDVTIDGNGHSITYVGKFFATEEDTVGSDDNSIWSKKSSDGTPKAVYVIQVYMANVTLKNISLNGGNRGLAINGGTATLDGSILFSNNGYQPIELSSGDGVPTDKESVLKVTADAWIVNLDQNEQYPATLYVDTSNGKLIRGSNAPQSLSEGANVDADDVNVNLVYAVDEENGVPSEVFTKVQNSNQNLVLVKFDDDLNLIYGWEFNEITDPNMTVNTNITFTEEAPEKIATDVAKLVTNYQNLNYLNFEHSGKLPGKASIIYDVSATYAPGTKLYIAHFNETTKELENVQEVTVDEEGYVNFDITECSSYAIYTGINNPTPTTVANAKTGDINLLVMTSLITIAVIGLIITSKKIASKVK